MATLIADRRAQPGVRSCLLLLFALSALLPAAAAAQASLNKCIDAQGGITYSNLPCRDARETRRIAIDPPPQPDPQQPRPPKAAPQPVPRSAPATIRLDTRRSGDKPVKRASARQCQALSDQLGRVLDTMDRARRKGYTQAQFDGWNAEIRKIEQKKQQSGCF